MVPSSEARPVSFDRAEDGQPIPCSVHSAPELSAWDERNASPLPTSQGCFLSLIHICLYDQLIIGGNASILGSLDVQLIDGFMLTGGLTFDILQVDGSFTGQFLGLGEGDLVGAFGDVDLFITYLAGDGNDVSLIAVPAPGSLAVLGMTGLLAGRRRRS